MGDKVEWQTIPLSEIKVSGYNPREISEEALRGLRSSLDAFGFVQNLVINRRTGNLISGHQRLKALQDEGGAGDKEVMAAYVDVDETHEKAMNVALNNPHLAGEYTPEVLDIIGEIKQALPELAANAS